ncbi:MAG: hypothetical protein ACRBEE_14785 [Arenicella sp.]
MNTQPHNNPHQSSGFFYRKEVIRWILIIFYLCCAGLFVADFFIHRHIVTDVERFKTFYALYGLIACVVLVLLAKLMRIVLIKEENYYDETEASEDFLNKQDLEHPEYLNDAPHDNSNSASRK